MKNNSVSLAIGLAAGLFGGLIGLGGGLIMIPLMISVLKFSQHQAHGTSLVALIFTGIAGALIYGLQGNIDFLAAGSLSITAIITARTGAYFANALPGWKLKRAFGAFLIFCAALMLIKPYLHETGIHHPLYVNILIFLMTGAATGFLSGMMGVGGGTIMVPAMVLLTGFGQHVAQGTSLLVMVPLGAAGALAHHELGNVVKGFLPGLIPGIVLGAFLGGNIANFIPDTPLRLAFIAAIIFMGVSYARSKAPE
ncbi:MAG: permease [Deltaproteobacteria bacterium HGW-Deltaproteobacteria-6]|nr:MAG: permease [Deltaproteobacteria bacterium HGW-Deltaproteobacteria-6]